MTVRIGDPMPAQRAIRPRNRRVLIVDVATRLFYERGYAAVGMSDIAEGVGIGPSALYRHFSGKQDLLREVLVASLAPVLDSLAAIDLGHRDDAIAQLCAVALDHREFGLLWQREARHLAEIDAAAMRSTMRGIGDCLARAIGDTHPELEPAAADMSARVVIATLTSPSFHRLELPRADYLALLAEMVGAVLDTPLPVGLSGTSAVEPRPLLIPAARREALLTQAIRMFARRGYLSVGLEDIGAAVGIAGTSVYNHFDSKQAILATAVARCTAALLAELDHVYDSATTPEQALSMLVRSYVLFTRRHHHVVGLIITDHPHLPQAERDAADRDRREYLGEWAHLMLAHCPDLDPIAARIRIQAVLAIANDTARSARFRTDPLATDAVVRICSRLLHIGRD
ncbi:TetR/AcrR family transcriptional regulator [Nocardia sp. NPDC057663]|uniref:TetR/AcrR family transcriptional regulator n=1 Tax=Nocardia sp. NPDC057663 TaxID=3346201 RepID=UPI00366F5376